MPKPKRVLNAFTAQQMKKITGISVHMITISLARDICSRRTSKAMSAEGSDIVPIAIWSLLGLFNDFGTLGLS
jgi:hypothetical protein